MALSRIFLSVAFTFLSGSLLYAQNIELQTQPAYQNFITGKNILYQKALVVPGSPFAIVQIGRAHV